MNFNAIRDTLTQIKMVKHKMEQCISIEFKCVAKIIIPKHEWIRLEVDLKHEQFNKTLIWRGRERSRWKINHFTRDPRRSDLALDFWGGNDWKKMRLKKRVPGKRRVEKALRRKVPPWRWKRAEKVSLFLSRSSEIGKGRRCRGDGDRENSFETVESSRL